MAIFSRSKKKQTTPPPGIIPFQPQFSPLFNQQSPQTVSYATSYQPNLAHIEQDPFLPNGSSTQHGQGWLLTPVPPQYQLALVQQNHIPPLPQRPQLSGVISNSKLKLKSSMNNLLSADVPECIPGASMFNSSIIPLQVQGTQYLNQETTLANLISSKFDTIITQIDGEKYSGDERELAVFAPQPLWQQQQTETGYSERGLIQGKSKGMVNNSFSSALTGTNYFAKVNLYINSRLPPNLPPLKLYVATYPLLCLAAQYSERVYTKPAGQERETHVDADWRVGTKAMVIKSVPMDDMNTIVFAIRGTQTFMDWAVNLNSVPTSPQGFLDDPGNNCHAGFLTAAKKMVKPVAARLRHLLQEDPGRSKCSLLITGHSAGGAVAALLYSHMLSTSPEAESELNILTGCFKRIHCVTFGAPPISLLPLTKPTSPTLRKSLFFSFVNEGDPVPRADKAYVRSLLDLYSSPVPGKNSIEPATAQKVQPLIGKSTSSLNLTKIRPSLKKSNSAPSPEIGPYWPVPEATLSNAGRIVLLRGVEKYENQPNRKKRVNERMDEGVVAQIVTDELLRGTIWGDPVCHMMRLYARRIEVLATNAVMGRS